MPELLPFQHVGADFLASTPRALLADGMRVGKTPQAIRACEKIGADRILVMCPAIARQNWLREFMRFGGYGGKVMLTKKDEPGPGLTVCSYDLTADKEVFKRLSRKWDAVITDEAHFLKNHEAKRTLNALAMTAAGSYSWALTATPAPNHAGEMWTLLRVHGITDLEYTQFVKKFCRVYDHPKFGPRIVGSKNILELKELIGKYMMRRTLAEVAPDMPPARWSNIVVEPGEVDIAAHFYGWQQQPLELVAEARRQEQRLIDALNDARDDLDRLQITGADIFRRLVGLQKVEPVAELVKSEQDQMSHKLVIFGWHRDVLEWLCLLLKDYGARVIDGRTHPDAREFYQKEFREMPFYRVLLCQITAAGTAIDLSTADDALFIESDYSPGNNNQAAHRIMSQFKRVPVRIRTVAIAGSVDERIERLNVKKIQELAPIFGSYK